MSQPTRPRWAGGCRRSPFQFQGRPNSRTPARCARWVSRIPVPTRWVSRIPLIRWVSHIPRIPGLVGVPYSAPYVGVPYSRPWVSRIHVFTSGVPVSPRNEPSGCPVFTPRPPARTWVSRIHATHVGVPYSRHATPRSSTGSVRAAAFGHLPVTFRADSTSLKNQIQREARAEDTQWLAQFLVWHWQR